MTFNSLDRSTSTYDVKLTFNNSVEVDFVQLLNVLNGIPKVARLTPYYRYGKGFSFNLITKEDFDVKRFEFDCIDFYNLVMVEALKELK